MEEWIKKSDAMDAVMWGNGLDGSVVDDICEKLEALPSADRPHGAWEYNNGDILGYAPFHKCGVCGSEMYTTKDTFCPNCGARMKGADDE